jgi:hypothetical protein
MARVIFLAVLLAITTIRPAYAYIDPGTASIALQAVIGAIAVAGFYFRSTIAKVLGLFRPAKPDSDSEEASPPTQSVQTGSDDG